MQVKGLAEADARELVAARGPGKDGGYPDPLSVWRRAGLKPLALEALARADAYRSQGLARREALWAVKRLPGEKKKVQPRSEEHTSELQSLMRNSYAVFCLKKN